MGKGGGFFRSAEATVPFQYFTRNLAAVQDYALFDWLKALYDIWKNLHADTVRLSSALGMAELMRYGCTTCFDHHSVSRRGRGI